MHHSANGLALFQLIPQHSFLSLLKKWEVDKNVRTLPTRQLLQALILSTLFRLDSLREIEQALKIPRSTLSDACLKRSSGFFADLCALLWQEIARATPSRKCRQAVRSLLAVDSTECRTHGGLLKFRGWKKGRKTKACAAKLHIVWNVHEEWIADFRITQALSADVTVAKTLTYKSGAIYVFDRAYMDLSLWLRIQKDGADFVMRLRTSPRQEIRREMARKLHPEKTGVLWEGSWSPSYTTYVRSRVPKGERTKKYRRILYRDPDTKKLFDFITSNQETPAEEIAKIYRKRWSVELLFRWLKEHLSIRKIPARTPNGVKIMLSIALLTHLLLQLERLLAKRPGPLLALFRETRTRLLSKILIPQMSWGDVVPQGPPVAHLPVP